MGCCMDLIKFFLFMTNFALWIFSGLCLSLCLLVLFHSKELLGFQIEPDLNPDNPTALYFSFLLILITLFGFFFVFSFLGCCGAACQNRCMLGSFIIILFVFLGADIGAIVFMFLHFPSEIAMIAEEVKKTIPYYDVVDSTSIVRLFWDYVQPLLQCCGAQSYKDWADLGRGLKPGRKVPATCCRAGMESDCIYAPTRENAFLDGCVVKEQHTLSVVFWAVPAAMAVVLVCALCVCSRADRYDDDDDDRRGRRGGHRGHRGHKRSDSRNSQYSEDTGYVYRGGAAAPAQYASAPPYNPHYDEGAAYPTGVVAPPGGAGALYNPQAEYNQPLMRPPPYRDIAQRNH